MSTALDEPVPKLVLRSGGQRSRQLKRADWEGRMTFPVLYAFNRYSTVVWSDVRIGLADAGVRRLSR